jgi:Tfp pilus assembly protein PilO
MRPFKRRECVLGGITLAVITGASVFTWLLEPELSRYARQRDEINQLQTSLTKMRANMRLREQIETRYEELKDLMRESEGASLEMASFTRLLSDTCGPLNVSTKSVRPLPDVDEGFYRKFALRIEMTGAPNDIAQFLADVEGLSDLICAERVELACKERPGFVTATLVMTKVVTTSHREQS